MSTRARKKRQYVIISGLKFICRGKTDEFKLYMGVDEPGVALLPVGVFSARSGEFIKSDAIAAS